MKNSNDTIGNRTRDLPACSAVPQPTAPPRSPVKQFAYPILMTSLKDRLSTRCSTLENPLTLRHSTSPSQEMDRKNSHLPYPIHLQLVLVVSQLVVLMLQPALQILHVKKKSALILTTLTF